MTDSIVRPTLSYLLRLWAEDDGGRWLWRVSVEPIPRQARGDEILGFPSLEVAVAFLRAEMEKEENRHD
ncbi:MAG: hypothetical protein ACE5FM_08065 [Methyloligellaceae bacterium]